MNRIRLLWLFGLLLFVGNVSLFAQRTQRPRSEPKVAAAESYRPNQIENDVLAEINGLRQNPAAYVTFLETLKNGIENNVIVLPGGLRLRLNEGVRAFDDAISELKKTAKLKPFGFSPGLSKVALMQMSDLKGNIRLGHYGSDGSDLEMRLLRVGVPGKEQAENISYNSISAKQIVLNMILDENVAGRPHRKNLLSTRFDQIGISYGTNNQQVGICVLVFNNNFREQAGRNGAVPVQ